MKDPAAKGKRIHPYLYEIVYKGDRDFIYFGNCHGAYSPKYAALYFLQKNFKDDTITEAQVELKITEVHINGLQPRYLYDNKIPIFSELYRESDAHTI